MTRDRTALATFGVLAVVTLLVHGLLGYTAYAFYSASSKIFVGDTSPDGTPAPSLVPGQSVAPDDEFNVVPIATPATLSSRINVLLTGVDSAETADHGPDRHAARREHRPRHGRRRSLISFPRDISDFPLVRRADLHRQDQLVP